MKKITQCMGLIYAIFVFAFTTNAQTRSGEIPNNVTVSAEMRTQIQEAQREQTRLGSQAFNRVTTATYVGSFQTNDGPGWEDVPPVYTGQEAAALIFGGNPSDYAISTNSNTVDPLTITHTVHASSWGDSCIEVAEDYSVDFGAPNYNQEGDISAYAADWCFSGQTNYVWLVDAEDTTSFITTWKTDNLGDSNSTSITIPTTGGGYSYDVDWNNDGIFDDIGVTGNITHDYGTAGTYTVAIRGDFPRIYFANTGDKQKILSVEQWGTIAWSSMQSAFDGCSNLVINATDAPDLSTVTNMNAMFSNTSSLAGDLGSWNVSNVTSMELMFSGSAFNEAIGSWTVSNVTSMASMFYNATAFDQDISSWNVSSVSNMFSMFAFASAFNQDIAGWNVASVTTMSSLLQGATAFDQNLGAWNVSNVTNMTNMFQGVTLSTANYDALLNGWSALTLQNGVNFHAGNSKYCGAQAARASIVGTYGWTIIDDGRSCPDYFITTWKTDNLSDGSSSATSITIPTLGGGYSYDVDWNYDGTFDDLGVTNNITHDYGVAGTYTVAIRGDFPQIYFNDAGDIEKILSIEQWGAIAWSTTNRAFSGCSNLVGNATDAPDLSAVGDTSYMFLNAVAFNGNIGNWNVSNVNDMSGMFTGATAFNQAIGSWNVSAVTNMYAMFLGANSFDQAIGNWNVSNVTNMSNMFQLASAFDQNIGDWNVSNVTNMTGMFTDVTLSVSHYDSLLAGWSALTLQNGVNFHAGNSKYCSEGPARANIISTYGWTITDGGQDASCAPPANDECAGAIALTCGTPVAGTTYNATDSGLGSPTCAGGTQKDVFYTLDVVAGSEYTITVNGGDYDGVLVTYTGSCGSLTELDCADNGFSAGAEESINFIAATTETIVIRTYDWSSSMGSFTITVDCAVDGFVYENGAWSPSDPNVDAGPTDNITVIDGVTNFSTDLEVNNITVMSGATLNVEGVLTINGDITNDGELVFVSTIARNGELAAVSGSSTITGAVTVERYMKAKRSYRMVSSAVTTTSSIHDNWQEGAISNIDNPNLGFGTHITGSTTDQMNGFDGTITGNPSMFTVKIADQVFEAIGNTDVNTLTAGDAYLLFVRGDRSIDLSNDLAAGETVLRATGSLVTGTQTQNFPTDEVGNVVMFGNPYQSAVNMNTVLAGSTNLNTSQFYVYDSELGDHGAYVTVLLPGGGNTSESDANQFLQPGQGGQVVTLAAGVSAITFNESDKAPGNFTNTSRNPMSVNDMLTVQLYTTENFNNGGSVHDSFGIIFAEGNINGLTAADAVKPMNFYENLGIDHDGTYLSIEQRELPQAGEVFGLYSTGYTKSDYTLKVIVDGLEASFLYLDDHFTGTATLLETGDTTYGFTVDTNNPLSIATDRFSIRTEQRLGVDDNSLLAGIRLYPNPLNADKFYINAPKLSGEQLSVKISDLTGRNIYEQTLDCRANTVTVPMGENIASGVYFVTLKHGGEAHTFRLIKE